MKAYGGSGGIPPFIFNLDTPSIHWMGGYVDPIFELDAVDRKMMRAPVGKRTPNLLPSNL
jgi:hypothetical protein